MSICTCTAGQKRRGKPGKRCQAHPGFLPQSPSKDNRFYRQKTTKPDNFRELAKELLAALIDVRVWQDTLERGECRMGEAIASRADADALIRRLKNKL